MAIMKSISPLILSFLLYSTTAAGLNSSTYFYQQSDSNITFTISAAADTGDIFFRLVTPAGYDWVSIGIGETMKDALMFVAYPNKNGSFITWSPRLSTGNSEPAYSKSIDSELVSDAPFMNSIDPDSFSWVISAVCRKCTKLMKSPLDLTSTTAPFMWAVGSPAFSTSRRSDSLDTPLRSHSSHGKFTIDMKQATSPSNPTGQLPDIGNGTSGASITADVVSEKDYKSPAHGILMAVALVILIPIEGILRTCIKSVKFHIAMMVLISAFFIAGLALAFVISPLYIRSKTYNSPHQILGIVIMTLFLLQFPLGFLAHRQSKKQHQIPDSPLMTTPPSTKPPLSQRALNIAHKSTSYLVVVLSVVDGALGWIFALSPNYNRIWAIGIVGFLILIAMAAGVRYVIGRSSKDLKDELYDVKYTESQEEQIRQAQMQAYQMQNMGGQNQHSSGAIAPGETHYPSVGLPGAYR